MRANSTSNFARVVSVEMPLLSSKGIDITLAVEDVRPIVGPCGGPCGGYGDAIEFNNVELVRVLVLVLPLILPLPVGCGLLRCLSFLADDSTMGQSLYPAMSASAMFWYDIWRCFSLSACDVGRCVSLLLKVTHLWIKVQHNTTHLNIRL